MLSALISFVIKKKMLKIFPTSRFYFVNTASHHNKTHQKYHVLRKNGFFLTKKQQHCESTWLHALGGLSNVRSIQWHWTFFLPTSDAFKSSPTLRFAVIICCMFYFFFEKKNQIRFCSQCPIVTGHRNVSQTMAFEAK